MCNARLTAANLQLSIIPLKPLLILGIYAILNYRTEKKYQGILKRKKPPGNKGVCLYTGRFLYSAFCPHFNRAVLRFILSFLSYA